MDFCTILSKIGLDCPNSKGKSNLFNIEKAVDETEKEKAGKKEEVKGKGKQKKNSSGEAKQDKSDYKKSDPDKELQKVIK